jgi:hypothetical protein
VDENEHDAVSRYDSDSSRAAHTKCTDCSALIDLTAITGRCIRCYLKWKRHLHLSAASASATAARVEVDTAAAGADGSKAAPRSRSPTPSSASARRSQHARRASTEAAMDAPPGVAGAVTSGGDGTSSELSSGSATNPKPIPRKRKLEP